MVGLLRGVAGELSDLVESNLVEGKGPKRDPTPPKGATTGLTPGPEKGAGVKTEEASPSDSYEEEGEEEEECSPDAAVREPAKEEKTGERPHSPEGSPKDEKKPAEEVQKEAEKAGPESKRLLNPKFDPHYLTKRLHLYPTGKASARAPRGSSGADQRSHREETEEEQGLSWKEPTGSASSRRPGRRGHEASGRDRRGKERPVSPDRPPLPRRPQEVPKKKRKRNQKKKNKGQKRKQRGRDFKAWTESRKKSRGGWE